MQGSKFMSVFPDIISSEVEPTWQSGVQECVNSPILATAPDHLCKGIKGKSWSIVKIRKLRFSFYSYLKPYVDIGCHASAQGNES